MHRLKLPTIQTINQTKFESVKTTIDANFEKLKLLTIQTISRTKFRKLETTNDPNYQLNQI